MGRSRTPDVCRFCSVPLVAGENWRPQLRSQSIKVCTPDLPKYWRERNVASRHLQRRHYLEKRKPQFEALRSEMLAAYGGKCACCGETTPEFLTLDHVRNDGKQHRRVTGLGENTAYSVYRWLKEAGWPTDGYQLLCMNCNWGRAQHPTRVCPHERQLRLVPKRTWHD